MNYDFIIERVKHFDQKIKEMDEIISINNIVDSVLFIVKLRRERYYLLRKLIAKSLAYEDEIYDRTIELYNYYDGDNDDSCLNKNQLRILELQTELSHITGYQLIQLGSDPFAFLSSSKVKTIGGEH